MELMPRADYNSVKNRRKTLATVDLGQRVSYFFRYD
jgi:hypothetical protein